MKTTPDPTALVWECGILPYLPNTKDTAMTTREIAVTAGLIYSEDYGPMYKGLRTIGNMPELGTLHKVIPNKKTPRHTTKRSKWWFESKREENTL